MHPASTASPAALRAIAHVAACSGGKALDRAIPLTLNFHPDRTHAGVPLLVAMLGDGAVRNQFETGTSNGGLSAVAGGARWQWESRIFGAAYDGCAPGERPKYGALNFRRYSFGGSPRFGSAHLRLRPELSERTTFCYPDSVFEPRHFGVAARCDLVARALADDQDLLDDYVEAHVHGPLLLARDVEALVLDPCFRGTPVEAQARRLPCALEWHGGFRLALDELRRHPGYRGAHVVALGEAIAAQGWLDPRILGRAVADGRHDPQDLKKVWHCIVRFGAPMCAPMPHHDQRGGAA